MFSKPNFCSIRRFDSTVSDDDRARDRKLNRKTRLNRPKVSVDQAPNRIKFSIRFDIMAIAKLPRSPVAPSCQVIDSFSLVTSSSSHHASHLWQFIRSLTRPSWSFPSTRRTNNFFASVGDFRQVDLHGHHQWMDKQKEVLAMGWPVIEDLAEGVPRTCTVWQRTLLRTTRTTIFYR